MANQHAAVDPGTAEAMGKVNEELEALNSLVTVLVVVFILLVVLQIIQTILKVMRPKLKRERDCKPHAVVVERGSSRSGGAKKNSSSQKVSSSRRGASLPSKRLCTVLSLSTESECEKSTKSTSQEPCTGSREECIPGGTHPIAFKRPSASSSDSSVPALEMSKEMAASLKMLNCADVANTPLPSTAPLAVPHTPSKSKSKSKESIEDSKEDKSKEDKTKEDKTKHESPLKTAPTQPLSNAQVVPVTPTKAPASIDLPVQATPTQTTQISTAAVLTTAANASPAVQSTQRLSVAESLTPGPKKNSPVKTAKEEVKEAPPAPVVAAAPVPAPAAAPPVTAMPPQQ